MKKNPIKYVIITDKPKYFEPSDDRMIVQPHDFINNLEQVIPISRSTRVINLSGDYDYLSRGYYASLLAEARHMPCIPPVSAMISLNWRRYYDHAFPEINAVLDKCYDMPFEDPLTRHYTSFFGRHQDPKIEPVTRKIFDLFRFPIISFEIVRSNKGKWRLGSITPGSFNTLIAEQQPLFMRDLAQFTGAAWRGSKHKPEQERYWLAVLHNPKEKTPPSSKATLKKFVEIGKKMSIWVELITKDDYASLLEYDALFIRETTAINNHTYRFAQKAESEGIPSMDDTTSIIRCCNKIYLNELMDIHGISKPQSLLLDRKTLDVKLEAINLPAVLKIPDGSFSFGVFKVSTKEDLKEKALEMLEKSEVILCQEFIPSVYDWRIGVLGNKPLFASKYYMAEGHWQIYNHAAKSPKKQAGEDECVPLDAVPTEVLDLAVKASQLIGDGLYGVDIKQLDDGRVVVIEVNDNPNIDAGVEDKLLGDSLYKAILSHIIQKIEA